MPRTVYLITQKNCSNCPAAKLAVQEAIRGTKVEYEEVDLQRIDPDFEFRLLESQVFIASTPSIVMEDGGSLKMLYSGVVPSVEDVRKAVGVAK